MNKIKISEVIIVEGKYDKIKLSSLIDGLIIQTDGFRIYKDKEKAALISAVAQKRGAIIVTDSDVAGFKLRGFIRSIAKGATIKNIYIPQISGKEKRKISPSKENLLGVEGIAADKLRELFAGLDVKRDVNCKKVTRLDFFEAGLSGGENSKIKRNMLLTHLGLPLYISTNALLDVINSLMTFEEFSQYISSL